MIYKKELQETEKYDLIVIGGGFSGFAAAYAGAREGLSVLLLEKGNCFGGVGTAGLVNHILGVRSYRDGSYTTSVGGVFRTIEERLVSAGFAVDVDSIDQSLPPHGWYPSLGVGLIYDGERMRALLEKMLDEVGAAYRYASEVVDVIRDGTVICGLVTSENGTLTYLSADYFVDATGDADITALAGCPTLLGDEEGGTAPVTLEMHVDGVDTEALTAYMKGSGDYRFRALIEPLRAQGVWDFPYDIFISVMLTERDVYMINTNRTVGYNALSADSYTRAITAARRENLRLFEIMKQYFPGFSHARIRRLGDSLGVRETRRIVGEHTLTVEELLRGDEFVDTVALSAYGWDLPDPKRPSHQPMEGVGKPRYTPIPYRTLVPKGADNLLAVGRCISVERAVLGPVRVMGPCLAMGEAAGIAAALAAKAGIACRDVDIKTLRHRLLSVGAIIRTEDII